MKLAIAVFAVVTVLSAADRKVSAADRKVSAEPRPSGSGGLAVPKGAVESEPGTFHYTDAQGKKWIYRKTPFGVARLQDVPVDAAAPALDPAAGIKATADGETIRFERPGPFGVYRWEKSRSELNDGERAALIQTAAKQTAANPTAANQTAAPAK